MHLEEASDDEDHINKRVLQYPDPDLFDQPVEVVGDVVEQFADVPLPEDQTDVNSTDPADPIPRTTSAEDVFDGAKLIHLI